MGLIASLASHCSILMSKNITVALLIHKQLLILSSLEIPNTQFTGFLHAHINIIHLFSHPCCKTETLIVGGVMTKGACSCVFIS